ncbi:MAG: ATP-binding cassette domain-containing protein [Rhodospirillaceae bacterium]
MDPPAAPAEVELSGIVKSFDGIRALDDVSFSVDDGDSLVLIGPSACGKTVVLKTIAGLIPPDRGRVLIRGTDMAGLSHRERDEIARIGMLFQRSALFDSLTVWENITFRLRQKERLPRRRAIDIAVEQLASVGLAGEAALLYPVELSGGMQKRVGIARALADNPEILLLDEPTAGLDPIMTNVINELILENVRRLGATVISVTSNLDTARHIASRIVMLNEGKVVWTGPVADMDRSENRYIDQFVHKTQDGPIHAGIA